MDVRKHVRSTTYAVNLTVRKQQQLLHDTHRNTTNTYKEAAAGMKASYAETMLKS